MKTLIFSLCYFVVLVCMNVNDVVLGLAAGVRCRDPANRNFLFHYASSNMAYTCSEEGSVTVQNYQGGCTHENRPVFRYKNSAWQSCVNGSAFSDVACVIDEECALKSDLTKLQISAWTTANSDGSCNRIQNLATNHYSRLIAKFSTCDFDSFSRGIPAGFTCDYSNFVHRNSSPDACIYGPDKYVFYVDNVPKYCIIRTNDSFNGLCLPMNNLWKAMKRNYSTYDKREHDYASNTEYKRYAIEQRMNIYGANYGGIQGDYATSFKHIGRHLSTYFPERHGYRIDDTVIGANVFCDVALRSFPMESYQIYQVIVPEKCPCIKSRCVERRTVPMLNDDDQPYPKNLFKIWYDANHKPSKCFLPQIVHAKTDGQDYCINFTTGAELIKQRNTGRANAHGHKNDYQASMLRTLQDPPNFQAPWHLRFEARTADSLVTVLRDMANALGFHNEPLEMEFTFGGETLQLGISAFCSILLEMVPFSAAELTTASELC